jgi:stringent starvation protein B
LPELSRRPYLLRAMHEWMVDSGHTPHAIVDATQTGVEVPSAYVNDGRIVLNLSPSATQNLLLGPDFLEFNARFSGTVHYIRVPINAILGIYARETGEGMVFSEEGVQPPADPDPNAPAPAPGSTPEVSKRPKLTVVK